MKKKMIYAVSALMVAAAVAFNVKTVLETNHDCDLTMASIDALSDDQTGEYDPSGGGISTESECREKMGYWNMALLVKDGGIVDVKCTVSGKLSVLGIEISGSYETGKTYVIGWALMGCDNSTGNCCIPSEQGTKVKTESLKG